MDEERKWETADSSSKKTEQPGQRLHSAFLVRYLTDGQTQQFILEDVATRQRRRFDSLAALQAWLQDLFTISKQ